MAWSTRLAPGNHAAAGEQDVRRVDAGGHSTQLAWRRCLARLAGVTALSICGVRSGWLGWPGCQQTSQKRALKRESTPVSLILLGRHRSRLPHRNRRRRARAGRRRRVCVRSSRHGDGSRLPAGLGYANVTTDGVDPDDGAGGGTVDHLIAGD